ncbi:MAG: aldehyde dehydrogenase [Candidatus Marinimicrobia bacterium]|jgi:aminomuconate-semialdehyde/2-hydroxymuconate-6-semialdehyde dehydrogenase|nr:aldehyde dehydrogenase [Candidatus Neomarinimicrobiota bacterium]
METLANFINGQFSDPNSGNYLNVFEPATGQVYAKVPDSNEHDINTAIEAAEKAFYDWSVTSSEERSGFLHKIADGIETRLDELAEYESRDTGKPLSLAKTVDIPRAVTNFRFFANLVLKHETEEILDGQGSVNRIIRKPLGIVGCISPWNLPLYLSTWKIAPAIAAGNCVIGKPSELTPYTAFKLGEICQEAELPNGVLNIVQGSGMNAGSAIVTHPKIKAISFTGGTKTGETISREAAPQFKKLSLELGGKNPNIIFADCDFDSMLETTISSSFSNQGEICLCGSRIFVEKTIYDTFRDAFVERTQSLNVGDPNDEKTDMGALISKGHLEKVTGYIDLAKEEGGTILIGGENADVNGRCNDGYFVEPTVIDGLSADCRTNQEEIFGPVVSLIPFKSEEEVIAMANSTQYGLSATIWTENTTKADRVAGKLDSGVVWVNCWMVRDLRTPFGGMKNSGVGREGGLEALDFFTEQKNICRIQ